MDRGAWGATAHGAAKTQTRLSDWTTTKGYWQCCGKGQGLNRLVREGLTEKVTFEKRFEEASHAYFWEKELSRQRNGKITFLLHFFFFSFLLNIADKIPLWSRLLRKLFWFFTSVFMYNKAQGAAYFKTIINICNKKWVFFLAIW